MADSVHTGARSWQVLLLGGPSGTGKTAVSYRLARHFGIGITEVDDFQVLLETMTTPEQQPVLHFWRTHPAPDQLSAKEIMEQGLAVGRVMATGLEAVIANHLEEETPVVLEGDFILPALAAQTTFGGARHDGQVRAIFLYEPDERQLVENFLRREPQSGPQTTRARVSWLYGQWLKQEAVRYGLPALPARPWDTVFDRILAALASPAETLLR
jgi:2-phosphoglycerate kinase